MRERFSYAYRVRVRGHAAAEAVSQPVTTELYLLNKLSLIHSSSFINVCQTANT